MNVNQTSQKSVEKVVVCNENGLHIRPAAIISQFSAKFHSKIELEANGQCVDARGVFDVLLLAATKGTAVTITAIGPDHAAAVARMAALFREGFPLDSKLDEGKQ